MPGNELQTFLEVWDLEAKKTVVLLKALPPGQYDFRPDAGGRSLGELAGHLAKAKAYVGFVAGAGSFPPGLKRPGMDGPKEIAPPAPAAERAPPGPGGGRAQEEVGDWQVGCGPWRVRLG